MFLVAGVSGNTGSKVADGLLAQKLPVRVLVRDAAKGEPWKAKGAEVAVASITDVPALTKAFDGIVRAYLLSPPQYAADDPIAASKAVIDSYVDALIDSPSLELIVFLSSIGAQHAEGTGVIRTTHYAEDRLNDLNVQLSFLRAAYFMENWLMSIPAAEKDGVLQTFLKEGLSIPMVATADIAKHAVEALVEPTVAQDALQIGGPELYSAQDVAVSMAKALRRGVIVQHAPLDAMVPAMTGMGMKPRMAELYKEMHEGIENGTVAFMERPWHTVRGTTGLDAFFSGYVKSRAAK